MPTLPDTELQARLLRETSEVNEKKRKLEAALNALDMRMQLLIDRAARKDIEAYNRHMVAEVANFAMMTMNNTQANLKGRAK